MSQSMAQCLSPEQNIDRLLSRTCGNPPQEIVEANGMNSRTKGARTRTQPSKFDVTSVLRCQSRRTNLRLWLPHLENELHVLCLRHLCDGLLQQCLGLLNELRIGHLSDVFHLDHLWYFVKPFSHQHPHLLVVLRRTVFILL